jgi:hypothetical protein
MKNDSPMVRLVWNFTTQRAIQIDNWRYVYSEKNDVRTYKRYLSNSDYVEEMTIDFKAGSFRLKSPQWDFKSRQFTGNIPALYGKPKIIETISPFAPRSQIEFIYNEKGEVKKTINNTSSDL